VSFLANESAFLYCFDERRFSFVLQTFLVPFDVVDLEGVVLFGVVHFSSISFTFSKRSAGSGIS
jgi:hypothetical protein